MNNLTTRKIVLGMLMVLVLAFGVQGIADALTLSRGSGDLQMVNMGQNFTISFSVSLASAQTKPGYHSVSGQTESYYLEGTNPDISGYHPFSVVDEDGDDTNGNLPGDDTLASAAVARYHNDQAVSIEYPNAFIVRRSNTTILSRNTTTDVIEMDSDSDPLNPATFSLHQQASGNLQLSETTITLSCTAPTAGEATITIRDVTPAGDLAPTTQRAEDIVFTIFVVNPLSRVAESISITGLDGTTGYALRLGGSSEIGISVAGTGVPSVPVTFSVTGGGKVFVQEGSRKSSETATLTTSQEATVYLDMKKKTNKVTVSHRNFSATVIYIYGIPLLRKTDGTDQPGAAGGRLEDPFVVKVTDSIDGVVRDLAVTFTVANADDSKDDRFMLVPGTLYGADRMTAKPTTPAQDSPLIVYTDRNGEARTYYHLSDSENQNVTVDAAGEEVEFTPTIETGMLRPTLSILSGNNQRTDEHGNIKDHLVVVVQRDGHLFPKEPVTFKAKNGYLGNGTRSQAVYTDANGEAKVRYYQEPGSGSDTVTARISNVADAIPTYEIERTFNINGRGGSGPSEPSNAITITLSSTTGEPGEEVTINVSSSPSRALVTLGSNDFGATRFSPQSDVTPFTSTLLLPVEEGTHTFFATGGTFTAGRASVTVEVELGTLSITAIGVPAAGAQTFSIRALDADGDSASAPFTARLSGSGFATRNVEIADGRGNARVTLPTTAALYTLTVSATGYEDGETPVRIAGTGQTTVTPTPTPTPTPPPADTGGVPDSIEITGPSTRSGTVNEELDTPLLVRVLDDDGDGLEGARVFYRVSSGRGRLSARGNGRAIGVVTDSDGYARAVFTPLDGGTITVRANTDDLSATVTFTITTGSAPSASGARDSGTGGTPGTISPVVHVAAASRPPMLWVDGGAIYALVGASPQRFASSVDNALNITVGGGKVYWTEKTGESGGTINSANLNGSGVTELASIFATPMGIAVDVTNSKLYWTNSAGRIQSANLDGSRITNELQNLASPMDIALAGGNAYWTQGGNVRFVNLRGQKVVRNVSTGMDTAGSLAIGGGKVYWTEMTGESGGTVNSANLNGTGATQLASILAVPVGIAVDTARSKLYWSNSRGRIQSANLDGSKITNVVSGLGSPGELVLSNSIATPTAATTTTRTTTTASKYDLNSDGTVDNTDAGLVADAMGTSNARYDVNGDGTVNFLDLLLVFDNRDPGAAGAPTIVGMKMSAAQIDIIEEQIDLLIATNDRSPSAMRVLVYLQQLLVTARPEKTQLLANYPNPFNPETWIPYELATDTNVRLTIYNTQGVVIRSLQFGHQSAGYYVGRDRAAYWDGRNALGEQVASGLYFYQLETDEMSLMRKMVILK